MVPERNQNETLPKVSVIVVTLNVVTILQRCLNSIYQQVYPNLEIIIIDGGSTDGTTGVIKKNTLKLSFLESEPDKGIYYAMNKGINHSTGNWIYFLGADDMLLPDFSEMLHRLKDDTTIYYGRVLYKGNKTVGALSAYQHAKNNIYHQAIIYPSRVFKKYRYSLKYPITADHLLNMQCWNDPAFKLQFVDLTIADFNHTGISSTQTDVAFQADKARLILKYYGLYIYLRFVFRRFKHNLKSGKLQS